MITVAIFLLFLPARTYMQTEAETFEEDKYGVKFASDCEVCKVVAIEFQVCEGYGLRLKLKKKLLSGQTVGVGEEPRRG